MDLAEFLLARIAEDELLAREASGGYPDWVDSSEETLDGENVYFAVHAARGPGKSGAEWEPDYFLTVIEDHRDSARVAHIARHDPARVLAECEAKRRIVEFARDCAGGMRSYMTEQTLRLLALPYAGHPQYDESWRL